MKKLLLLTVGICLALATLAKAPQGFSYQAVLRNAEGQPLANQTVSIRLTLQSEDGNTHYYSEVHNPTTSPQGVISVAVGTGSGSVGNLTEIPWAAGGIYLQLEVDPTGGTSYALLGQTALLAVPYALYAASGNQGLQGPEGPPGPEGPLVAGTEGQTLRHDGTSWVPSSNLFNADANVGLGTVTPTEKLEVAGNIKAQGRLIGQSVEVNQPLPEEEPIFVVRNSAEQIVFAVYEGGVRAYVDDTSKQTRGGFAIGGLSDQNKEQEGLHFFSLTPDSVRFNIYNPTTEGKQTRGGFAIGGLSDQNKSQVATNLLFIAPDSARIYVNESVNKQTRGGFAIGGLSDQIKTAAPKFLDLTPENYFIGHEAGQANTTGIYNSFIGYLAGKNNTEGNYNSFFGYKSGYANDIGRNNTFLGYNTVIKANYPEWTIAIGDKAAAEAYSINFNQDSIIYSSVYIGANSGEFDRGAFQNLFLGNSSGQYNSGTNNLFIGAASGQNNVGNLNLYIGDMTGFNSIGNENIFIGYRSGLSHENGDNNTYFGNYSGGLNGTNNICVGYKSGLLSEGNSNIFIGKYSGKAFKGDGNIFIGLGDASTISLTSSNKLYIDNSNTVFPLISGEFDTDKLRFNAQVNIRDFLVLEPRDSAPTSPTKGTVYYDNSDNKLKVWDGEAWRDLW